MSVEVVQDDCREFLKWLPEDSFDSCVTDPPYSLQTINKRFAKVGRNDKTWTSSGPHQRTARGFMNQKWDTGETSFDPDFWAVVLRVLKPGSHVVAFGGTRTYHRLACAIEDAGLEIRDQIGWAFGTGFPKSHNLDDDWQGWGTALKPAWEPIVLARKPLIGTVAANVLAHGTGALNIDGCRVESEQWQPSGEPTGGASLHDYGDGLNNSGRSGAHSLGRWPANLIHDGGDEVLAAFPQAPGQQRAVGPANGPKPSVHTYGDFGPRDQFEPRGDKGSAARFFYCAKASTKEREGSKHPTVKPIALMEYLVRLVTPPGGTVLDPFAGSGTTGVACKRQGFNALLVEREAEYVADIERRLAA